MKVSKSSKSILFLAFIILGQGTAFSATAYQDLQNPMKQICGLGKDLDRDRKTLEIIRKLKESASKMSASEANRHRLELEESKTSLQEQKRALETQRQALQGDIENFNRTNATLESLLEELENLKPKHFISFVSELEKKLNPLGTNVSFDPSRGKGSHSLLKIANKTVTCPKRVKQYILNQVASFLEEKKTALENPDEEIQALTREKQLIIEQVKAKKKELEETALHLGTLIADLINREEATRSAIKETWESTSNLTLKLAQAFREKERLEAQKGTLEKEIESLDNSLPNKLTKKDKKGDKYKKKFKAWKKLTQKIQRQISKTRSQLRLVDRELNPLQQVFNKVIRETEVAPGVFRTETDVFIPTEGMTLIKEANEPLGLEAVEFTVTFMGADIAILHEVIEGNIPWPLTRENLFKIAWKIEKKKGTFTSEDFNPGHILFNKAFEGVLLNLQANLLRAGRNQSNIKHDKIVMMTQHYFQALLAKLALNAETSSSS